MRRTPVCVRSHKDVIQLLRPQHLQTMGGNFEVRVSYVWRAQQHAANQAPTYGHPGQCVKFLGTGLASKTCKPFAAPGRFLLAGAVAAATHLP